MPQDIRSGLETLVVFPLFKGAEENNSYDQSLPEIVLRNRVHRARERILEALVSRGSANIPPNLADKLDYLVRDWRARSFEDGYGLIQDFEIQCAQDHDLVMAEESGDQEQVLAVLEREYRRRIVEQFGSVELRGIQISHRVILDLDKVYVPLHVEKANELAEEGEQTIQVLEQRLQLVDVLTDQRRILVIGSPGSGKSTLVSFLATGLADGKLASELEWSERPLPLVIVVRALREAPPTLDWLPRHLALDQRLLSRVFKQGRAIFLVDGMDEAPESVRAHLTTWLTNLAEMHPAARVIVTSRPTGMPGEIEGCLRAFQAYRLSELTTPEVEEFIDKWCLAAETSVLKDVTEARSQARVAADDLKSRISRNRSVQRIAVNPLLTTILCVVHRFQGRSIPEHRVTLYEKCTDLLLYEWDRAKFPEGTAVAGLDAPQKRTLLRGIARLLHDGHIAEISEDQVVQHFAQMLPDLGKPKNDAVRIVHEIQDRSGLLVERRPGFFGFSHLTFQEYLTALDYTSRGEVNELVDRWEDGWWHEVIALAAGVPGASPARVTSRLLAKKNDVATVLATQCMETSIDMPRGMRKRIEAKLAKLVPPDDVLQAERLRKVGLPVAPLLLKVLQTGSANQKTWSLYALQGIDYDPAIPIIARCASETAKASFGFGRDDKQNPYTPSVGEVAIYVLLQKTLQSDLARRALVGVMSAPLNPEFLEILADWHWAGDTLGIIRDALRDARQDKPTPTPVKSTV